MDLISRLFGPAVPGISAAALDEKLKGKDRPLLLDVRQPEEFRNGHIAGARLIPLGELPKHIQELPQGKEIVCVCASGNRSTSASKMLMQAGYPVLNLQGGMFGWRQAGLPVKKD